MSRSHVFSTGAAALLIACAASAQTTTTIPFTFKTQLGTTVSNAVDGSSIAFMADAIGRQVDATISGTHLGTLPVNTTTFVGTGTITSVTISGSTDFSLIGPPDSTQTFTPNQTFAFNVRYKPTTSNRVTGAVTINWSEQLPTPATGVLP